ncbi:MAG: PIN domain-containing protein [Thaumarchaeota archaeon]|nr:PIN domain-containing protein [Nitrososphaerota archaeon]
MKILLDTTYLLPAIGISLKDFPRDVLIMLRRKGNQVFISDISIFELSAKGAKYVSAKKLSAERVIEGIRAIVFDENIVKIPIHESRILLTALRIRDWLSDFIDCLIISSALNQCDALISEDTDIQSLEGNRAFHELLEMINPKFEIRTLAEIT